MVAPLSTEERLNLLQQELEALKRGSPLGHRPPGVVILDDGAVVRRFRRLNFKDPLVPTDAGENVDLDLADIGLDHFNGTFFETLDADISESGGTVTLSLQQEGGGDLTMRWSTGPATLDCTPAQTIELTVGSDDSPQSNYIYVLESTGLLTKSTTQWPNTEHIKVGYYLVPSAAFVASDGCYVQQQWNDHRQGTDNQGHLSHLAERLRRMTARYYSGIDPNGTTSYLTIDGTTVDYKATAGVVYQLHPHSSPAVDTSGGDKVLVVNWNGDAYHDITNLYDIVADSGGNTIGNNKWFNLVIWGVANKSGTYEPAMINLPSGFYNTQASAEQDISGFDNFAIPREFDLESSTGFLIVRLTIQKQANTWALGSAVDLRREDLLGARGGASAIPTEFPDNTFAWFDESDNTKRAKVQLSGITAGNTRTLTVPDADGTIALTSAKHYRAITVENPTSSEDIPIYLENRALTITNIFSYLRAGTSVTFNIAHGTNPTSPADLWSSDQVANTLTSVQTHSTSYNDATVAQAEAIKLTTSALSGVVVMFHVVIEYTLD